MNLKHLAGIIYVCLAITQALALDKGNEKPLSLEEHGVKFLLIDCYNQDKLAQLYPHDNHKQAHIRCKLEQDIMRSLTQDDTHAYHIATTAYAKQMGEAFEHFVFFSSHTPPLFITPLMLSVVFSSNQIFDLILQEGDTQISHIISHDYKPITTLSHQSRIYDSNGVSALDLSAMYQAYDMFYRLLEAGSSYNGAKFPNTSGIVTFGDETILELMLAFDEHFIEKFGGGKLLHICAKEGNTKLLEYLILHKGVDINQLKMGQSPLDAALSGKNFQKKPQLQSATKLIELGAKVSEANAHRLEKLKEQEKATLGH